MPRIPNILAHANIPNQRPSISPRLQGNNQSFLVCPSKHVHDNGEGLFTVVIMSTIFVGNSSSSSRTITWQPEPLARGTWSILSVCVITTALCVWTALHLNIPPRDQKIPQFWRKLYWLGIGLFAPEIVAYTAWNQRQAASKGLKGIRNAAGQRPSASWVKKTFYWSSRGDPSESLANEKLGEAELPTTSFSNQKQWTMAHAYYAYMGGFELDSSDPNNPILPPGKERMRLTLKGVAVALKLRPDLLRDFPNDAILDKSKASPLAKAIVCGQALWFCLQCLGRVILSAPLSLLEVSHPRIGGGYLVLNYSVEYLRTLHICTGDLCSMVAQTS